MVRPASETCIAPYRTRFEVLHRFSGVNLRCMSEDAGFRELVGTELLSTEEGRAVVSLRAEERHLNPNGTVHGGVVYTLVDVSMAEALKTLVEGDERPVTIEIKINYLEPGKPGTLTSTAQVRKGGKRLVIVEAEVAQGDEDDGEVVALATGTYTRIGG
jgi:uncharacterized protein (TIGR00369 family)